MAPQMLKIKGKIVDQNNKTVQGLRVQLGNIFKQRATLLQQFETTKSNGQFSFSLRPQGNQQVSLKFFFVIYDGEKKVADTRNTHTWSSDDVSEVEISVKTDSLEVGSDVKYVVKGHVLDSKGSFVKMGKVVVYDLFNKGDTIVGESIIGETTSDKEGFYFVEYDSSF